jgi:hypothetical protein
MLREPVLMKYSERSVDGGARPDHNWRDLYDKIPPERRAKIEVQVMHDLEKMDIVDRCEYLSVAWRCVRAKGHKEGHSPFLEDGEWMAQRPQCF